MTFILYCKADGWAPSAVGKDLEKKLERGDKIAFFVSRRWGLLLIKAVKRAEDTHTDVYERCT